MQQHPDGKRETDCSPQVQTQMVIADQQRPSVSTTRWNKYVQTKSGHYFFQKEFPYFVVKRKWQRILKEIIRKYKLCKDLAIERELCWNLLETLKGGRGRRRGDRRVVKRNDKTHAEHFQDFPMPSPKREKVKKCASMGLLHFCSVHPSKAENRWQGERIGP
jgi:hypothetical protein